MNANEIKDKKADIVKFSEDRERILESSEKILNITNKLISFIVHLF
ncbi:10175_t:CDS:2 [Dentiscutata erythropus]|uniref:10175_t:CDS:1 n=1 Tax=Dentiscutata erythropus TaxID=1348616 RepID=A0A9N9EE14_9GLOM|nr:10175_t:CDS:2 [Dentiscutata erythropus]